MSQLASEWLLSLFRIASQTGPYPPSDEEAQDSVEDEEHAADESDSKLAARPRSGLRVDFSTPQLQKTRRSSMEARVARTTGKAQPVALPAHARQMPTRSRQGPTQSSGETDEHESADDADHEHGNDSDADADGPEEGSADVAAPSQDSPASRVASVRVHAKIFLHPA